MSATTMNNFSAIPAGMEDYAHAYAGVWAITAEHANLLAGLARGTDLRSHIARAAEHQDQRRAKRAAKAAQADFDDDEDEDDDDEPAEPFQLTSDGVAIIEARGVLMKFVPSLTRGTSTVQLRRSVRLAASDARVRGIMLVIESPGGSVAGLPELGDEVLAATKKKPVWAYAEDLMASAAYWVGSQTNRIGASRTAMVGSCGTIYSLWDMSEMYKQAGVEVVIIQSGELKGAGAEGTKITAKQRDYFQALIDETNTHFQNAVESGRPAANAKRAFREAAVYVTDSQAMSLGLVDEVTSFDAFYAKFVASLGEGAVVPPETSGSNGGSSESDEQAKRAAAVDDAGAIAATVESTPAGAGEGVAMSTPNTAGATPGAAGGAQPASIAATAELKPLKPAAASASQIRTACAGATGDFMLAQVEAGASLEDAMRQHIVGLNEKIGAHEKTIGERDASMVTASAEIASLAAKVQQGVAASVNQPASQAPAGADGAASSGNAQGTTQSAEDQAKAEWAANDKNCHARFGKEKHYCAFRTAEIAGMVKGRRRSA